MSVFKLRPSSTSLGLPGVGNTTAHAGKPASGQQSHHKLYTLDSPVARNELLAKEADPVARAQALASEPPVAAPPSMAPRRGLAKLLHGAAMALGVSRGEPVARAELLRYAGTPLKPDGDAVEVELPGDLKKFLTAFFGMLDAAQVTSDARIAVNEAAAVKELVACHLAQTEVDLELSARRAGNLANRAHVLQQQGIGIAAELATVRDSIASTSEVLASVHGRLVHTHDEIAQERQALASLASLGEVRQPTPSSGTGTSPLRDLMREERMEIEREQLIAERQQRIAQLTPQAAHLQAIEAEESASFAAHQARARELVQQQQALGRQIKEVEHVATAVVPRDLWNQSEAADKLRAQQEPLKGVVCTREATHASEGAKAQEASEAYAAIGAQTCSELLQTCPGFEAAADLQPLHEAVRAWSRTLDDRLARFGDEALPNTLAVNIAFEALGAATDGNTQQAVDLMSELQATTLDVLLPPPGVAHEALPGPSEAARGFARLLADEPSGLQMLQLLLAPTAAPMGGTQAEAARLYLRADTARRKLPDGDTSLRDWIASAQRTASTVAHASDPAQALAACTVDERAAYRGFLNGYESNAPGSDYDKANQHLKKPLQWLKDRAAAQGRHSLFAPSNPLNALREGLAVGAATALPTPARQAAKALEEAAGHLNDYLAARHPQRPAGHLPSPGELAWQAIAHHVQWHPEGADPITMKLDTAALGAIEQHRQDLQQYAEKEVRQKSGGPAMASTFDPAFDATWKELQTGKYTVLQAMNMLHQRLPGAASPDEVASTSAGPQGPEHEKVLQTRLHIAVAHANRLLREGDPAQVTSARSLFDLTRNMVENLEWRDKLRLVGQKVWGVNAGPISAGLAVASWPTGLGIKPIAGMQHAEDQIMEIYMGRTGLYLQLGEQATDQLQGGVGVNVGYVWGLGDEQDGARAGVGGSADWKIKSDSGLESGVQLRVLRLSKGQEPELMAKFLDMYEHLVTLADREHRGEHATGDWMRELLAYHDNLNVGLIDNAVRENTSTETNVSAFAGVRVGEVDERPRRVNLSLSAGVKAKRDQGRTQTEVTGYMTTLYRDSTAQAKVEANARAAVGVMLKQWSEPDPSTGELKPKGSLSSTGLDLGYAAEIRTEGVTRFCTLFTMDKKIDPVRSDCAMDFQNFEAFECEVRREWNAWVDYGTAKLPADMSDGMRYAVSERQLENMLEQGRLFAAHNQFATMYMDKALKAKAAPVLDGLRTLSGLQHKAHREQQAQRSERQFDDLIAQPALWEPTILMLREKTKAQAERGIDFFGKYQNNRIAEAMRTVAQWPPYEPVPRAEPGQRPEPARLWLGDAAGQRGL
jgi:hypothetical protein